MKIFAVTMVRNESDIIQSFLNQSLNIFDHHFIIDVKSTDGTKQILDYYSKKYNNFTVFTFLREQKFQSLLMNRVSRLAFKNGADWVFLLDADEFMDINSRQELQLFLNNFDSNLMSLNWINLIPQNYGNFTNFDIHQNFYVSNLKSNFYKIAISRSYFFQYPDFHIHEGNHFVSPDYYSSASIPKIGISILHLPIRSKDRFEYKIINAKRTLLAKHNRKNNEGVHVISLDYILKNKDLTTYDLNYIASNYGFNISSTDLMENKNITFDKKIMLNNIKYDNEFNLDNFYSIDDVISLDSKVNWDTSFLANNYPLCAFINYNNINIRNSPANGFLNIHYELFNKLDDINFNLPLSFYFHNYTKEIELASVTPKYLPTSAWVELIPIMFFVFSLFKPRRFVELGTHYGLSFFAACQINELINLDADCIAVDHWMGDSHADFYTEDVFLDFLNKLKNNFPYQNFIRSSFDDAAYWFEDGSIDLLHIDGFHSYEAVRKDFETWLPKMSKNGVIMFHDTCVYEKDFGVWKLWSEISLKYPNLNFKHGYGLGLVYVGSNISVISNFFLKIENDEKFRFLLMSKMKYLGQSLKNN